jgi:hypothetical protein
MSRHGTPMIKKGKYEPLVYETHFDTLIGDALRISKFWKKTPYVKFMLDT